MRSGASQKRELTELLRFPVRFEMSCFIAHQAFNKCDRLTVRRPTWDGYLERRLVDRRGLALCNVDRVDLRDPPVVVTWTGRGSCDKLLVIGRPIVVVDVKIRWGHLA